MSYIIASVSHSTGNYTGKTKLITATSTLRLRSSFAPVYSRNPSHKDVPKKQALVQHWLAYKQCKQQEVNEHCVNVTGKDSSRHNSPEHCASSLDGRPFIVRWRLYRPQLPSRKVSFCLRYHVIRSVMTRARAHAQSWVVFSSPIALHVRVSAFRRCWVYIRQRTPRQFLNVTPVYSATPRYQARRGIGTDFRGRHAA